MTQFGFRWRSARFLLCLAVLGAWSVKPAEAQSPVKLHDAIIMCDDLSASLSPLTIEGTASHLGEFSAVGEISFVPDEASGSVVGVGVVVLEAANGDLIAGIITLDISPIVDGEADVHIHISWRDDVEFADGSVFPSTGRFAKTRPPGVSVGGTGSRQWISAPFCIYTR
jgi:hypothetical protein